MLNDVDRLTIKALDNKEDIRMSSWELNFMESMVKAVKHNSAITAKQQECLHKMAEKYGV